MVYFGSQTRVTLTCCSLQFAVLIMKMKTLYCEHFLSNRFKCQDEYCYTYSTLHIARNICILHPSTFPPTREISHWRTKRPLSPAYYSVTNTVNNALNCLSSELFKYIAEEWHTFCRSRKDIQKWCQNALHIGVNLWSQKKKNGPRNPSCTRSIPYTNPDITQ